MIRKVCFHCHILQDASCFTKNRRRIDGLNDWCKTCMSAYKKERYLRTKTHQQELRHANYIEHRQEYLDRAKARSQTDDYLLYQAAYHAAHRYHLEEINDLQPGEWQEILAEFNFRCAYCLRGGRMEMEHLIPVSRGGRTSRDNIVPACRSCNASKGNKTLLEFVEVN